MSSTVRRTRWNPPPPPTPRILNLPRRTRRRTTKHAAAGKPPELKDTSRRSSRGKLESLFDQERVFARTIPIVLLNAENEECERRERVEVTEEEFRDREEDEEVADEVDEERWRFQAEILRAECNFLRVERDIAVKKLELNRIQTKRTLRSAVETLVSGKEKIHEGKSVSFVLEEEIKDLEGRLKELQRSSVGDRDFDFKKCSNFDKQACLLQRKLDKLGEGLLAEEKCAKQIRDIAGASLTIKTSRPFDESQANIFNDVEILRRKMERLSTGLLERMEEEYGSILSSATSSTSTSRRIEFPHLSSSAQLQSLLGYKETKSKEDKGCSGRCKDTVRKLVEQVRAEMEQWSLMQEVLERVREEMEDLQCSRDFWQDRALDSDQQLQTLQLSVQEWKRKARHAENNIALLEKHNSELRFELKKLKEKKNELTEKPREMLKEKEKHVLICRLKENHHNCGNESKSTNKPQRDQSSGSSNGLPKRSPLREIPNSSPLLWEHRFRSPFAMP